MQIQKRHGLVISLSLLVLVLIALAIYFFTRPVELDSLPLTGGNINYTNVTDNDFLMPSTYTQKVIKIDKTFKDREVLALDGLVSSADAIAITAKIDQPSPSSKAQIIMLDDKVNAYLISDAYRMLYDTPAIKYISRCEETCVLSAIKPKTLLIRSNNATVYIESITIGIKSTDMNQGTPLTVNDYNDKQDKNKISKIGAYIKSHKLSWSAGSTKLSRMTYKELTINYDAKFVQNTIYSPGYEFFAGGTYNYTSTITNNKTSSVKTFVEPAPTSFDWRNVNGKNLISPVKNNPNTAGCWADAATALLESQINLYYNQQLNLDLSEQAARDCAYDSNRTIPSLTDQYILDPLCPSPGSFNSVLARRITKVGLFDEACDPFRIEHIPNSCSSSYICSDWQSRVWKASDYQELFTTREVLNGAYAMGYDYIIANMPSGQCSTMISKMKYLENEETFKKELIKNGPMQTVINAWGHDMLLIGYGRVNDWINVEYCDYPLDCSTSGCITKRLKCNASNAGKKTCEINGNMDVCQPDGTSASIHNGCKTPTCQNSELGTKKCIDNGIYKCIDDGILPYWAKENDCEGLCINEKCVSITTKLNPGDRKCIRNAGDGHYVLQQYTPGSAQTYWIFKNQNQGGKFFGDNGFINVFVPYEDLVSGIYLNGPYTLPTNPQYIPAGFTNTIKCEDLDNDSYCNWGISQNKPASCPQSCKAVKDCDDTTSSLSYYDKNMNCVGAQDLSISVTAAKVIGSTFDLKVNINNTGVLNATNVAFDFNINYDKFVSATGFNCTPKPSEYKVYCNADPIQVGKTLTGTIRITAYEPNPAYRFQVSSSQTDLNPDNNKYALKLNVPIQQCNVKFNGNLTLQECIDIDTQGIYKTVRGDLRTIFCVQRNSPQANDCIFIDENGIDKQWCRVVSNSTTNDIRCEKTAVAGTYSTTDNPPKQVYCDTVAFPLARSCTFNAKPRVTVIPTKKICRDGTKVVPCISIVPPRYDI